MVDPTSCRNGPQEVADEPPTAAAEEISITQVANPIKQVMRITRMDNKLMMFILNKVYSFKI